MCSAQDASLGLDARLRLLYPQVDERATPLPRSWSTKDKYNYIALSANNLRVQYKGHGKTHKDASSIRATHAVPASCGLYYFEIKIVSKGRDGYMGVGLSAQGVNMNRLPGWDKYSYGYHGDDGHSFCSSGTGQPYGPTFTTGDVIGCGLNLVDHTCFYTKNGTNLGVAFRNMPPNLFPTVGLQTPGEIVDANFGQHPFVFDIEAEINELRNNVFASIENFAPTPQMLGISSTSASDGAWQVVMHKLVSAYLEHEAFASSAAAFNTATAQTSLEPFHCVKARQRLIMLIKRGKVGRAIAVVKRLYPRLLQSDARLHFRLRVRQFVEMVADACLNSEERIENEEVEENSDEDEDGDDEDMEDDFEIEAMLSPRDVNLSNGSNNDNNMDVTNGNNEETDGIENNVESNNIESNNINSDSNVETNNSNNNVGVDAEPMEENSLSMNLAVFNRLLNFGRQVFVLYDDLKGKKLNDPSDKQLLDDAFALLAYSRPFESPLKYLLTPKERENVATALNEAILESKSMPKKTMLQSIVDQTNHLLALMAANDMGACAFASLEDIVNK